MELFGCAVNDPVFCVWLLAGATRQGVKIHYKVRVDMGIYTGMQELDMHPEKQSGNNQSNKYDQGGPNKGAENSRDSQHSRRAAYIFSTHAQDHSLTTTPSDFSPFFPPRVLKLFYFFNISFRLCNFFAGGSFCTPAKKRN